MKLQLWALKVCKVPRSCSGSRVTPQHHRRRPLMSHDPLSLCTPCSCKASVTSRNANGQTAYDVALESECDHMVALLAAQAGLDLLGKPRVNLELF